MNTLSEVSLTPKQFSRYKKITPKIYEQTRILAQALNRKKIYHINSTSSAGGVAELLNSQIPLERSLGLDSRWFTIAAGQRFFGITKKIHNLLQGVEVTRGVKNRILTPEEKKLYFQTIKRSHKDLTRLIEEHSPDMIVIHDPQPLPFIENIPQHIPSILRIHIDLSTPHKSTLSLLRPYIEKYDRLIVSTPQYRPAWLPQSKTTIVPLGIDPFRQKNRPLSRKNAERIIQFFSIHTDRPIISQVSRFDKWKDPLGVIKMYYLAKNEIPDLQLILAGEHAPDDPESKKILAHVQKHAKGDPDIYLFTERDDEVISAIQTISDVVIQKSLREGFGLTVTEAMWKGRPVIGGKTAGIGMQINHNKNGYLVSSPREAAAVLIRLLKQPNVRTRIGNAARIKVHQKLLFSHFVRNNIKAYRALIGSHRPALHKTPLIAKRKRA